jgi:hypothetical protein
MVIERKISISTLQVLFVESILSLDFPRVSSLLLCEHFFRDHGKVYIRYQELRRGQAERVVDFNRSGDRGWKKG